MVVDIDGCLATDNLVITIKDATALYIPNAFTPNGDGNNDEFAIYGGVSVKEIKLLRIFDRYGELVHEKHSFAPNTAAWDGKWLRYRDDVVLPPWGGDGGIQFSYDKSNAAIDVYAVYIEVEMQDGTVKHKVSDLTVVR